jgi:signal transduction histidine kinase
MMLPLLVRGESVGVLTLLRTADWPAYTDADLNFANSCAVRLALALENARLYRSARFATQARDELLGIVSHDLRNPISAIAMCGHVLQQETASDPHVRNELAANVIKATNWMQRLIQDLLDVSLLESRRLSIERQEESLCEIVRTAIDMVSGTARERSITVRYTIDSNLQSVEVDAGRIIQVLTNILGNALKFTPIGGAVSVDVKPDRGSVCVRVIDTGIGISPHDQLHVFDQYWRARHADDYRGSGLGLAIARGIVEAHGGHIWVESILGQGSIFAFTLPASVATHAPADASVQP